MSVGNAITLFYVLLTLLLGSPIDNSQHLARGAAAALIVGLLIVGIYIRTARRERLLGTRA